MAARRGNLAAGPPPAARKQPVESIYNLVEQGRIEPRLPPQAVPAGVGGADEPQANKQRTAQIHHKNSSQISNILNPVRGVRDQMQREGKTPTNHARDNRTAIKEASSRNQLKKMEQLAEMEAKAKGGFRAQLDVPKKPQRTGMRPMPRDPNEKDYINENKMDAVTKAAQRGAQKVQEQEQAGLHEDWTTKKNYGSVPGYLRERKMELMEVQEQKRLALEANAVPAGMRILPEDERLRTLQILAENKKNVETDLQKLPFTCETPSQIRRRTDLERRMAEIEDAQKIFSRKQVFVRA